jgi:hypothetical protein
MSIHSDVIRFINAAAYIYIANEESFRSVNIVNQHGQENWMCRKEGFRLLCTSESQLVSCELTNGFKIYSSACY